LAKFNQVKKVVKSCTKLEAALVNLINHISLLESQKKSKKFWWWNIHLLTLFKANS